jgi:ATP-binding cassette subfamily B protein
VIVPLSFKEVIDSFGGNPAAAAAVALPVVLLVVYASSRLMAGLFSELRSALFARVAQNAVRSVSTRLFNHVQHLDLEYAAALLLRRAPYLSLRYHLSRQTGAFPRVIERGTRGISFFLRSYGLSSVRV